MIPFSYHTSGVLLQAMVKVDRIRFTVHHQIRAPWYDRMICECQQYGLGGFWPAEDYSPTGGSLGRPTSSNFPAPRLRRQNITILHFYSRPHKQPSTITMAGKYELLCLENPLLDIQGVG